jgi:transposase
VRIERLSSLFAVEAGPQARNSASGRLAASGCGSAYTIAAEIGDISRFASPRKLAGYTGLCPRVYQSGERDLGGPLAKQGPRYLRWALVEAATHACTTAVYRDRYQQIKARIGKQRGAKVGQIDLARRLSDASWHMLSRDQPFASKGATDPVAA